MQLNCPEGGCSGGPFANIDGLASHIHQYPGCHNGVESYSEAREIAESVAENRKKASGSDDDSDDDPPGVGGESGEPEKPHMQMPEPDELPPTMECPECGDTITPIGAKKTVEATVDGEVVNVTTDKSDFHCPNCKIVCDGEGGVAHLA